MSLFSVSDKFFVESDGGLICAGSGNFQSLKIQGQAINTGVGITAQYVSDNFTDRATAQSITGAKTFVSTLSITGTNSELKTWSDFGLAWRMNNLRLDYYAPTGLIICNAFSISGWITGLSGSVDNFLYFNNVPTKISSQSMEISGRPTTSFFGTFNISGNTSFTGTASFTGDVNVFGNITQSGRNPDFPYAVTIKSGNYTPVRTDDIILCNASGTTNIRLPAASTVSGKLWWVKRMPVGAGTVVISGANIDGATGVVLLNNGTGCAIRLVSDGNLYWIM
jgi:hypothetical protein